jgi:hypothetical protein
MLPAKLSAVLPAKGPPMESALRPGEAAAARERPRFGSLSQGHGDPEDRG